MLAAFMNCWAMLAIVAGSAKICICAFSNMVPIDWAAWTAHVAVGVDAQLLEFEFQGRIFELLFVGETLAFNFDAGLFDADALSLDIHVDHLDRALDLRRV